MDGFELPAEIMLDAWTGKETARSGLGELAERWGAGAGVPDSRIFLGFGPPTPRTDWRSPDVGYGVLLPNNVEIPAPIADLIRTRPGTVILRWDQGIADGYLRRKRDDGSDQDANIASSDYGTGNGKIPQYILIAAPPTEIPWDIQYELAVRFCVGRLPFSGEALRPYVDAMLHDWDTGTANLSSALIWATDYGPTDITRLMTKAIAAPLRERLNGTVALSEAIGEHASAATLLEKLATSPGLVVTSSHGSTPLDDLPLLKKTLGLSVDQSRSIVSLDDLDAATPAGCVWFAQACCSAGSSGKSIYTGLLDPSSTASRVLTQVAKLGSTVAPGPLRLLGRENPIRAFFGHVEPTFDWTLRDASTKQLFGGPIVIGLSTNMFGGQPIGYILDNYRRQIGSINTQYWTTRDNVAADTSLRPLLSRLRLTALDRQALVLLGDPTVAIRNIFSNIPTA